jgi:hypothetical protein
MNVQDDSNPRRESRDTGDPPRTVFRIRLAGRDNTVYGQFHATPNVRDGCGKKEQGGKILKKIFLNRKRN